MMSTTTIQPQIAEERDHLVSLPGSEWSLWRWVCLRGAGFPSDDVLKLAADPETISAAHEVARSSEALELVRFRILQQLRTALDELRSAGQWENKQRRKPLLDAISKINTGKLPRSLPEGIPSGALEELTTALAQVDTAKAAFQEKFSRSLQDTSNVIRKIAGSADFREALTWQNRTVVETALDPLLRGSPDALKRDSIRKQHEELVASYWQRYCVKNDTIGFFGPVGWARIISEIGHIKIRHKEKVLATRKTYWESWAIDALGAVLARKYNLQPWIVPILVPYIRVEDTTLVHPLFSLPLTAKQSAILRACNGHDTAKQIAAKLMRMPNLLIRHPGEVYEALRELATKGVLFWKFNIPLGPFPEQILREALQRIEDLKLRQQCLDLLEELDATRVQVEDAAGDPARLNFAFQRLEQAFTRLTGLPATRSKGKIYAGRTLVYEDCRRDTEVLLERKVLECLAEPLSLLLDTGRWFTARVAQAYEEKIQAIYSEIRRSAHATSVDAALWWYKAAPFFFDKAPEIMDPLQDELEQKWERVLQLSGDQSAVHLTCNELRPRLLREFPSSLPGWQGARYHSPDIMIAAADEEAIRDGRYIFVLGEVHVSTNTLQSTLFVNQHPSPPDLLNALALDLGEENVVPAWERDEELCSSRLAQLIPKTNFRLEFLPNSFITNRSRALPISSMILENHNGTLMAKTRDGKFCLRALDLVGGLISRQTMDCFRVIAPQRHAPRISLDSLIIKRESWHFSPEEIQFAYCAGAADRFLQARNWARAHGIPRFVFYKVPVEKKPAYLDFDSPIFVDIFSKMIRRTVDAKLPGAMVDLSEMLPLFDQIWLTDVSGRRYTSEFRFVAVDSRKPAPSSLYETNSGRASSFVHNSR
jgi:lantibiotic biosynthesis dehydratase-like protein